MNSIRRRLSLTLALVLLAAGVLLAFALRDFPRRMVEEYVLARLDHDADLLYVHLLDALARPDGEAGMDSALMGAAGPAYDLPLSGHYFVVRLGGRQWRSRSTWDADLDLLVGREDGVSPRLAGPAGQALLVVAKRFPDSADGRAVSIALAEDVAAIDAAIAAFRAQALTVLGLALLVLLVLQRRVLVRGLVPLDEAVEACRRLERGEAVQFEADAPAEVRPLLAAVERLSRHQAQRLGRIRHAAGNLSHALKTPLSIMRNQVAQLPPEDQAAIGEQLDQIQRHIDYHLGKARVTGAAKILGVSTPVRARVEYICRAFSRLYPGKTVDLQVPVNLAVGVEEQDFDEMVGNLLENAFKWSASELRISSAELGGWITLRIEDDGPGMSEDQIAKAVLRGVRLDEKVPGSGLGLNIVSDLAEAYRGSLIMGRAELGGLAASLSLPKVARVE